MAARSMPSHKYLDQDVLRKCILLYPILLGRDFNQLDKTFSVLLDLSITSKDILNSDDSLSTQVQELLRESKQLQKLWHINTTTKCTIHSSTKDKDRVSVKEDLKIRYEPGTIKRLYKDPNTCPGPCFNCHGTHHEYVCPWACNRCNHPNDFIYQAHVQSVTGNISWDLFARRSHYLRYLHQA